MQGHKPMVFSPLVCSDNPADAQAAAAAAVAAGFLPPSALPPGYKCAHGQNRRVNRLL